MENELELLRRLYRGIFSEAELLDIFYENRDKYRVLLHLIQQPKFPVKDSLSIIPKLYPMDLIRVIKNRRTNPQIRKRAEMEFVYKYTKYPMGEKLSYLKVAPNSLLAYFVEENDKRALETILGNSYCTEELLLKFINRRTSRHHFYEVLSTTEWYKRPQVAEAVIHDLEAPIRILLAVIPYLNIRQLEKLYNGQNTHQVVKKNIIHYLDNRSRE